ncbi:MAG TPA: HAMP domain-containing sensor histidine kinase [Kofleriaceae bacterium]|nr:HAMP domain-containing sensor histidine kinase [Kofleriaceae bacterium]
MWRSEHVEKSPEEPGAAEVLAAVSHDLRNPLGTIVLGSTVLLSQVGQEPRARRALEMIQRSAHKMERMLEMLTDISSLESGKLELQCEDVDVAELLRELLAERSTPLTTDGAIVHCDRKRVARLLESLVGRAHTIHVSRNGGKVLFVIAESVPLRTVERYVAHGIVCAHGGEIWTEGSSVFFTLPEA